MSQFSAGITAMQSESKYAKAYNEGVAKTKYWEVRETTIMCVCLSICLFVCPFLVTSVFSVANDVKIRSPN